MTRKYVCWIPDYEAEESGRELEGPEPDEVAADACEWWNDHGRWSGDPIPDEIVVHVRDVVTRELFEVPVGPSYSVDFYAGTARKVAS